MMMFFIFVYLYIYYWVQFLRFLRRNLHSASVLVRLSPLQKVQFFTIPIFTWRADFGAPFVYTAQTKRQKYLVFWNPTILTLH